MLRRKEEWDSWLRSSGQLKDINYSANNISPPLPELEKHEYKIIVEKSHLFHCSNKFLHLHLLFSSWQYCASVLSTTKICGKGIQCLLQFRSRGTFKACYTYIKNKRSTNEHYKKRASCLGIFFPHPDSSSSLKISWTWDF